MEELIGITIDNYKIVSTLGKGGMGIVYKAYDTKLERYVAIKMLAQNMFGNERHIERFKREAKNQANLTHTNIVTVFGFIEYSDLLGIVMEYIEGESLEKVIYRQGRFNIFDAVYIMKQLLAGMSFAHSRGFVHRDIKPSNIIFNQEGVGKVMDFGISKSSTDKQFTKPGSKLGTVYYMSPEQVKGEDTSSASDIYSIGATFYEMIVGRPPFDCKSEYEVMDAHVNKMPSKISDLMPGTPTIVDELIERAMAKNPLERFASCEEFARSLAELEKYLYKIQENEAKKAERMPAKKKFYSILGFSIFGVIFLIISYFIVSQSQILVNSGQLEKLDKYNINSLFESGKFSERFKKLEKQESQTHETLHSIEYFSDTKAFAIGDSGIILRTNNKGKNWEEIRFDRKITLRDGYYSPSGRCIIVGDSSAIYKTRNFFTTCDKIEIPGNQTIFRIHFINNNTGFILGSKGLVMKTNNGGLNWRRASINSNSILYDISFNTKNTGFIVGWNGIIYKTTDEGETWELQPTFTKKYLRSIDFVNEDYGVAVGGGGTIFRTDDGGSTWKQVRVDRVGGLQKVKFISEDIGLIAGSKGMILYSNDKGASWRPYSTGTFVNFNDMAITRSGLVTMVGKNGTILTFF